MHYVTLTIKSEITINKSLIKKFNSTNDPKIKIKYSIPMSMKHNIICIILIRL